MKKCTMPMVVIAGLMIANWMLVGSASGADWSAYFRVCPTYKKCPDDYCRKPLPNLCNSPGPGTCPDYGRKPLPNLQCVPPCGGPNDYCRKPLPKLLCPPNSPFLRCGAADCVQTNPVIPSVTFAPLESPTQMDAPFPRVPQSSTFEDR